MNGGGDGQDGITPGRVDCKSTVSPHLVSVNIVNETNFTIDQLIYKWELSSYGISPTLWWTEWHYSRTCCNHFVLLQFQFPSLPPPILHSFTFTLASHLKFRNWGYFCLTEWYPLRIAAAVIPHIKKFIYLDQEFQILLFCSFLIFKVPHVRSFLIK